MIMLALAIRGLLAWWVASVATEKGRNVTGWAIFGFFFGLLAVIIVYCVGTLKPKPVAV